MTAIAPNYASSLRAGLPLPARSSHAHAKAGNLNAALPQLQGELVAVMDADVVPQRGFLQRTVSLLEQDSGAALVQTPQSA